MAFEWCKAQSSVTMSGNVVKNPDAALAFMKERIETLATQNGE